VPLLVTMTWIGFVHSYFALLLIGSARRAARFDPIEPLTPGGSSKSLKSGHESGTGPGESVRSASLPCVECPLAPRSSASPKNSKKNRGETVWRYDPSRNMSLLRSLTVHSSASVRRLSGLPLNGRAN
jgi:hypothetical protein